MVATPLLARLRHATQGAHQELDRGLALLEGPLTRARYGAFLQGTFAVVSVLEPSVFARLAAGGLLPDAGTRMKASLVASDLEALDAAPTDLSVAVPGPTSDAEAFGCGYVLEGSMLGGAVLARGVEAALGLHAAHGTSYFHAYGEGLGARWRLFLERLAAFDERHVEGAADQACAAARSTFASFADAFRASGALPREDPRKGS